MPEFMYLYRGGAPQSGDLSPREMEAHMAKWDAWVRELEERGAFRTANALSTGGRTVGPQGVVRDGPFPESKEVVGGYSLVSAAHLDEAAELAGGCPIFEFGGHVEVRPIVDRCLEPDG